MIEKEEKLKDYLKLLKKVGIAFSAGVDSTYLLKIAKETLGLENVIAITINSNVVPNSEISEAEEFCKMENIKHIIIPFNELEIEGFSENPKNRCYICKKALFTKIKEIAKEQKFDEVIEGTNMDDLSDYRPGLKAVNELGIKSPLKEAGLYKSEIRELSKILNLKTWEKPSFACLATRIPYGEEINSKKLEMIEKSENYLKELGIKQYRVRIHGNDIARIEVEPFEIEKIIQNRKKIVNEFKMIGFNKINLDLEGYKRI